MSGKYEPREYTPEEIRKIYAKFEKEFTCEKLIEYIEDSDPKVPFRQVIDEIEAMVTAAEGPDPNPEID